MAVPGDHLGGRDRCQAERPADEGLDLGVDVGVGPYRPRELPHRHPGARGAEALAVAVGLETPEGQLGSEGGRLGVHPVGPAGHGDVHELKRPGLEHRHPCVGRVDQEVGRRGEGGAEGGVDDVGRGEPVMDE